jgi:hypothetical protein
MSLAPGSASWPFSVITVTGQITSLIPDSPAPNAVAIAAGSTVRSRMGFAPRAILAGLLGVGMSFLAACGGSPGML